MYGDGHAARVIVLDHDVVAAFDARQPKSSFFQHFDDMFSIHARMVYQD